MTLTSLWPCRTNHSDRGPVVIAPSLSGALPLPAAPSAPDSITTRDYPPGAGVMLVRRVGRSGGAAAAVSAEEGAHGLALVNPAHRLGECRCHREHGELPVPLLRRDRHGVRAHDLDDVLPGGQPVKG